MPVSNVFNTCTKFTYMPILLVACAVLVAAGTIADRLLPEPDFAPVDQAFQIHVYLDDHGKVHAHWRILPRYYLYRHALKITSQDEIPLKSLNIPRGTKKVDEYFGEVEVYHESLQISADFPMETKELTVLVSYQGCAELGFCYAEQKREFKLVSIQKYPKEV